MRNAAMETTKVRAKRVRANELAIGGLLLALVSSQVWAQAAPDPSDRLCTAGFNTVYGLFENSDPYLFGIFEPAQPPTATCTNATSANLGIALGGTTLPLASSVIYQLAETPAKVLVPLLEPALCEDYFSGAGAAGWNLVIEDANGEPMMPAWGKVDSIQYSFNTGALELQRTGAVPGAVRCYSGLAPNAVHGVSLADPDYIFGDSMELSEQVPDLRVEFLDADGLAPLPSDLLTQVASGSGISYRARVSNIGAVDAVNVRIREFVPTNGALLGPTVARTACTDYGLSNTDPLPCSSGVGAAKFAVNLGSLAAGAHRDFKFTRTSSGTDVSDGQSMALIQVAVFSDPSDGETAFDDNSRSLRIKMVDNESPVADSKNVTTAEDAPKAIVLTGSDPEGDPLSFQVTSGPSHGSLSGTAPNLTYTPALDYNGSDSFTYVVNDGHSNSPTETVSITITPVDDGPRVNQTLVDQTYAEGYNGVWIEIGSAFMDPEGDAFTLAVSGTLPSGLAYNATGKVIFNLAPLGPNSSGNYPITVTATNAGTPPSASQTFTITVTNVNQTPVVGTPLSDRSDAEGSAINFSVASNFSDADSDPLTFTTGSVLPAGLSLAASGVISGTIGQTAAVNSPYNVTITANDGQGGTVSDTFEWVVTKVNLAPVVAAQLQNKYAVIGELLDPTIGEASLQGGFSDPDSDPLTLTVSGLPTGLTYSAGVGISGTPQAGTNGAHVVTVTATDPDSASISQNFTLTVYGN